MQINTNSRFLVTGGAGFIGSNLCERLLNEGHFVRCLDDLSTGSLNNIESFSNHDLFEFVHGSILDESVCATVTADVDYVLHQAAWGSVPRSIELPLRYEEINIRGTLNMMEASAKNEVKKFIYASSSSVYGDDPRLPKIEGNEGRLLSPYALTKMTNEQYGSLYKSLYNLDTYGLRYFNVFGRRQSPKGAYAAVIPRFIQALLEEKQPQIHGDGLQSRDFTYIDDVIQANLKACCAPSEEAGQAFNIAAGGRYTIVELFDTIAGILGKSNIKPLFGDRRAGDIKHSFANIEKAKRAFGYTPTTRLEEGLRQTIAWFLSTWKSG